MGYWEGGPYSGLEVFHSDAHDGRWRNGSVMVGRYLITSVRPVWQVDRGNFIPHFLLLPLTFRFFERLQNMPRATSDRFSRGHDPSVKPAAKKFGKKHTNESSEPSSSGTRNPIFNTERFGQHILKNPLVAQG